MIKNASMLRQETRTEMRGGKGSVVIDHFFEPKTEMRSPIRMCARLTLAPGTSIGFHRHDREEEIFIVVKGHGKIDDNGTVREIGPGDAVLTGNGAGHAVECLGPETLELVAVIGTYAE